MRNFKSNKKGQFVVIAALLIAVLTLAIAASIYQLSSHRRELSYKPVNELVLGIASDVDRALTHALSNATKKYYNTLLTYGDTAFSQQQGNLSGSLNMLKWQRVVLASYPQLGLSLNFSEPSSFTFQWDNPNVGLSQASIPSYELNIGAYGFKGWTGQANKYVKLTIHEFSFSNESYSTIKFKVEQSTSDMIGAPIPNLALDDITILGQISDAGWWNGTPKTLDYIGGGSYILIFQNPTDAYPRAAKIILQTPEDEILVSASTASDISIRLQSRKVSSPQPDNDPAVPVQIKLGSNTYSSLPQNVSGWENMQSGLECDFSGNMDYYFVCWETSEDIAIANPNDRETMVTHFGNGTITAVYDTIVSNSSAYSLTVTSRLEGSGTSNVGSLVFDGTPYATLPRTFSPLSLQDHTIVYNPASGYTFARWEFTPASPVWITLSDEHSSTANLRLFGNGTLTAVYQQRAIILDSNEFNGTSAHLGTVTFNAISYGNLQLPATLVPSNATVSNGQYTLTYAPLNASYHFMWWEITGDIILTGPNTETTTVEVHDSGSIKAVYAYMVDIPHQIGGTLYVDSHGSQNFWLIPTPPENHGHLASRASTGSGKAILNITAEPLEGFIVCDPVVAITTYMGISPGNAPLRTLEFELGFTYQEKFYRLGYWAFTIDGVPKSRYDLTTNVDDIAFPNGDKYLIPAGSVIKIDITATFTTPPGGTIKLYYGPDQPSCLILYL